MHCWPWRQQHVRWTTPHAKAKLKLQVATADTVHESKSRRPISPADVMYERPPKSLALCRTLITLGSVGFYFQLPAGLSTRNAMSL